MINLLASVIISVCPVPSEPGTTECHEFFVNCAVTRDGDVTEESIEKCLERYREEKQPSSNSR